MSDLGLELGPNGLDYVEFSIIKQLQILIMTIG